MALTKQCIEDPGAMHGQLEIMDVTLRDDGHAVDFDWPIGFVRNLYKTLSGIDEFSKIELGYCKQTSISTNTFYNLDLKRYVM